MPKLRNYASLKEKEAYFEFDNGVLHIDSKNDFNKFWKRLNNLKAEGVYCFRGSGEAKYKLFTSIQRLWIERNLLALQIKFDQFIKKLIEQTQRWNGESVVKFLSQNGVDKNNSLAYLSFMQHYGIPTPLLDFTTNPFTGLYFAAENARFSPSDEGIDEYFSLYIIDKTNPYFSEKSEQFKKDVLGLGLNGAIDYQLLSSNPFLFISIDKFEEGKNSGDKPVYRQDNPAYKILNNMNILNQDGVFFYNSSPDVPIEICYLEVIKNDLNLYGSAFVDRAPYREKFAECVNINKNLRQFALDKLAKENIYAEYIYPDLDLLAKTTVERTLSTI